MQIGQEVEKLIKQQIGSLISDYTKELNEAYDKADGPLSVSFTSSIKPQKGGDGIDIKTTIAFVLEKIKDETEGSCSMQMTLYEVQDEPTRNRMTEYFALTHPRHLIDIRMKHCENEYGPHCTLRYPCFACEGEGELICQNV